MQGSELNVILWKAFEDLEFRKQFYSRGTEEVLRSHGIPEEQIQTLIAQDIPKLLEYGLVALLEIAPISKCQSTSLLIRISSPSDSRATMNSRKF